MSQVVSMKPKAGESLVEEYKPTEQESRVIDAFVDRVAAERPVPRIKVQGAETKIDHPDPETGGSLLLTALATTNTDFCKAIIDSIVQIGSGGRAPDEEGANRALSMVTGVEPRDPVETMLATQMAAIHMATITMARRLVHVETIQQQDAAERALNKLARTFAAQVDTLKRYRSKGEQRVYVERVNVGEGGQAIVGNVETGGRG